MAKRPTRPEYPTRDSIIELGQRLCEGADAYADRKGYTEKHFELTLFCLLKERQYSRIAIQRKAKLPAKAGARRPNQLDFELGNTNRVALEFAVRRLVYNKRTRRWEPKGHTVSENLSELRKLTRETVAKVRYLLIVDVSGRDAVDTQKLKRDYKAFVCSKAFAKVESITVIYVHPSKHVVIEC